MPVVEVREQPLGAARPPGASPRSPDFASLRTRSSRRSTCSRSATISSSRSVSRSAAGIGAVGEAVEHGEERVDLAKLAEDLRAGPGTSTTRIAAGVTFFEPTTSREPVEPVVGDHRHPEVRLLRHVGVRGDLARPRASAR